MVEVPQEMIGLDAASAELDKLMAADAAQTQQAQATPTDQSASQGQRAAQTAEGQPSKPDSTSDPNKGQSDTPAAADQKPADQKEQKPEQQQQKPEDQKEPTRYEKARRRQDEAWKQINDEKSTLKSDRERFERERAEFEQRQQAQEQQYSPAQYEEAAKKFEGQGKFELAELARQRAEELRKNPPPTPQQAQVLRAQEAQHKAQMKEWWGKAAVDFPEVAKDGSRENVALKTFLQAEPDAVRSPKGMYYAARLVKAETAAARVPELDKELGALRAKVKELEGLTAPGSRDNPSRLGATVKSDAEEMADLERLAESIGPLR